MYAEKVNGQWLFRVGDKAMTAREFAAFVGLEYNSLVVQLSIAKKNGYLEKKLEEYLWRKENRIPKSTSVVMNPAGEFSCTVYVLRKVPELREHQARKRLRLWKQGMITTEELYKTETVQVEEEEWGDLAHLSNKEKPNPFRGFQGTKWDRAMLRRKLHDPDPMLRRY